jgi:tetratricopeptide (TPR) repeat protein
VIKRLKIFLIYSGLLIFLTNCPLNGQILKDTTYVVLAEKNVDCIYNMQFNDAQKISSAINQAYPGHPIEYLIRGLMTYWEHYPLLNNSPARESFEKDMRQCIKLAETNNNQDHEAEYLLANVSARGMLLTFYSENDLIAEVIPLTISTYRYLRRSFDFTPECTDLYYFTGIYNYYREAYPRIYPVYKSLALLFPSGDEKTGLKELQIASSESVVLRAESTFILSWIYLNYENNYPKGLYYCKSLHEEYPDNPMYLATYIKNLLLMGYYDEAEKLIDKAQDCDNKYLNSQLLIMKGIVQEKKYGDNNLAREFYNRGINDISYFGGYGNEFASFAYYGLSRISEANREKNTGKMYRREANKLADFKKINFDN